MIQPKPFKKDVTKQFEKIFDEHNDPKKRDELRLRQKREDIKKSRKDLGL